MRRPGPTGHGASVAHRRHRRWQAAGVPADRPIPVEVADLTPDWLTAALGSHGRGARVVGVEVLDAHSGTTGRARLGLTYRGDPGPLPPSVFCKLAPFDPGQRRLLEQFGIGAVEARFYAELAGDVAGLGVRVPGVWHAGRGAHGTFVMVLEDLAATGGRFRRAGPGRDGAAGATGPADPDRARATVEALARLHAGFWESPRFAGDLSWVPERAGFGRGDGRGPATLVAAAHFATMAVEAFAADMPPVFREVGDLYAGRTAEVLDLWDRGKRTLVHGDPHRGNLFDDGDRAGFYDWAMFSRSPGMRDVAYYCATSLPTGLRRELEGELVAAYLRALRRGGVDLGPEEADRQYRYFAVFAWVSMASTAAMGSRWQPAATALEAMARATAAVEDLGSLDVLRPLLG